ncbi:MAG: hypothetical protein WBH98_09695 [Bacteroidales bacterium]
MKKINLLLIAFLSVAVCNIVFSQNIIDSNGKKQGQWEKYDEKNNLVYKGQFKDDLPVGEFTYYYPNGNIQTVIVHKDNNIAEAKNYFDNGILMATGKYKDQKKQGKWEYYNKSGNLINIDIFDNGKKQGVCRQYYPTTGTILEECNYVNDKKDGLLKQYFTDKSTKAEINFKDGMYQGKAVFYYPNKQVMMEGEYCNDHKIGKWTTYNDDGKIQSYIIYEDGQVVEEKYFDKEKEVEMKGNPKAIDYKE